MKRIHITICRPIYLPMYIQWRSFHIISQMHYSKRLYQQKQKQNSNRSHIWIWCTMHITRTMWNIHTSSLLGHQVIKVSQVIWHHPLSWMFCTADGAAPFLGKFKVIASTFDWPTVFYVLYFLCQTVLVMSEGPFIRQNTSVFQMYEK